jgi:hypothetical protein
MYELVCHSHGAPALYVGNTGLPDFSVESATTTWWERSSVSTLIKPQYKSTKKQVQEKPDLFNSGHS